MMYDNCQYCLATCDYITKHEPLPDFFTGRLIPAYYSCRYDDDEALMVDGDNLVRRDNCIYTDNEEGDEL